jgi:hypothetical protein
MKTSALLNSSSLQIADSVYRFLSKLFPVITLPLFGLFMMHFYGPFLWSEFYSQFLWLLSIAFFLQFGSVQMMGISVFRQDLADEVREGLQSRYMLLVACCLLLFFLPLSLLHCATLCVFLLLRFTGDTLTAVQRLTGYERKSVMADVLFWIVLIAGIVYHKNQVSAVELMRFATIGAAVRVLVADPRAFGTSLPLHNHAPDFQWMREAFRKFIPQLSGFLFYTTDLILASILLPVFEFSSYQVTVSLTLMAGLLFNTWYTATSRSRSLQTIITTASLCMVPVALLLKFVLEEFAGIALTPLYLLSAYLILVSGVISVYFIRWLLEDREEKVIQSVLLVTSAVHVIVLPNLFADYGLQEYLLYLGGIHTLVAIAFTIISFRKGYN